jgi:high-affinity nickel permease
MNSIFDACVWLLQGIAAATGLSYQAVNVIIFVFIGPALFLGLIARIDYLERRLAEKGEARRLVGPFLTIGAGVVAALMAVAVLL